MNRFIIGMLLAVLITGVAEAATGIDNNNPMNIRISTDHWQGAVGDDGTFIKFVSPLMGIRAAARVLRTYRDEHGLNTIAGIVNRWAPPFENDTRGYIKSVSHRIGVGANVPLTDADYHIRQQCTHRTVKLLIHANVRLIVLNRYLVRSGVNINLDQFMALHLVSSKRTGNLDQRTLLLNLDSRRNLYYLFSNTTHFSSPYKVSRRQLSPGDTAYHSLYPYSSKL